MEWKNIFIPLEPMGQPADDGAAAVLFLVSDQAGYITGTTVNMRGGLATV